MRELDGEPRVLYYRDPPSFPSCFIIRDVLAAGLRDRRKLHWLGRFVFPSSCSRYIDLTRPAMYLVREWGGIHASGSTSGDAWSTCLLEARDSGPGVASNRDLLLNPVHAFKKSSFLLRLLPTFWNLKLSISSRQAIETSIVDLFIIACSRLDRRHAWPQRSNSEHAAPCPS